MLVPLADRHLDLEVELDSGPEVLGMAYVRTYFPEWEEPLPGAEQGEVEYELTAAGWRG